MKDSMILRLTRLDGTIVNIVGGAVASCQESNEGGTILITFGDEGDVYHVKESLQTITDMLDSYLNNMIIKRLERMEADPRWSATFRLALSGLQTQMKYGKYYDIYETQEYIKKIYQKMAVSHMSQGL